MYEGGYPFSPAQPEELLHECEVVEVSGVLLLLEGSRPCLNLPGENIGDVVLLAIVIGPVLELRLQLVSECRVQATLSSTQDHHLDSSSFVYSGSKHLGYYF